MIKKTATVLLILMAMTAFAAGEKSLVGNRESKKFHRFNCRYANCKACTVYFDSVERAKAAGYVACKVCKP